MFPRLPFSRQAGGTGNRKCRPRSHDCLFLDRQDEKRVIICFFLPGRRKRPSQRQCKVRWHPGEPEIPRPFGARNHFYPWGGRRPIYPVLKLPLSRKRRSWEHGLRLRFPFPPACRGKGNYGNMACACNSLPPLPVEETAIMGPCFFLALRGIENASQTLSACSRLLGRSLGTCTDRYPADAGEEPLMPMLMLGSVLMNYMFLAC